MINKVILVGNVGMDPEVRSLESGSKVARIRLATTERIYNRQTQESREHTEWHTVVLWGNLADVADRFVKKGSQLYIEGSIRTREWTDRDNNKRYSTEILANDMKLLGRRQDSAPQQQGYQQGGGYQAPQGGQPGYGQGQGGYGQQPYAAQQPAQPAPQPAAPQEDPDDLPF